VKRYINIKYTLEEIFIQLLMSGYLFISMVSKLFNVSDNWFFAVPFRGLIVFFSLYFIVRYFKKIPKAILLFFPFFGYYIFRLVFDYYYFPFEPGVIEVFPIVILKFIGACCIPFIALWAIPKDQIDFEKMAFHSIIVFFLLFFINVLIGFEFTIHGRTSGLFRIYSISLGNYGVSLSLIASYFLIFKKNGINSFVFLLMALLLGLYILYVSGTRSPLLAFVACLFYMLFAKRKIVFAILFSALLFGSVFLIKEVNVNYSGNGPGFVNRISGSINAGDSSGRGVIYRKAYDLFMESPFFGGGVLLKDGTFAHNFILEILMGTGIFGLILFALPFISGAKEFLVLTKSSGFHDKKIWIFVVFIQYTVLGLFAASLFDTSEWWYFMALSSYFCLINCESIYGISLK
jgi:O-antigen ligase